MRIFNINCGTLKLDAGGMFGVVPKTMWSKVYPADENNLAFLSMRSLLIEDGDKLILIDCGAGDKFNEKLKGIYHLSENFLLEEILNAGYSSEDVTDVILTHLHFDHCGGATIIKDDKLVPSFPNATYHISSAQWEAAASPVLIEKASYFPEDFVPLKENNQLNLFNRGFSLGDRISIRLFNGHTNGLAVPLIRVNNNTIVYISDLIPLMPQIKLSWICAYDNQPVISLEEKTEFLDEIFRNNWIIFSEHDYYRECCTLTKTEKGISPEKFFKLETIL
jgi:glyoxylase-like metal-dependent hydrolase (beta-lactamase superfamily II)